MCAGVDCGSEGSCVAGSCNCTSDSFLSTHCRTPCDCSGHGTQTGIAAARAAGACDAGSCECTTGTGKYIGEQCEQQCLNNGVSDGTICTCAGNFIGALCDTECDCSGQGTQTAIATARTSNSCSAGACTCSGTFAGPMCEVDCAAHGGASADDASCVACTDNFIGSLCQTECDCSGHGTQTGITAARAAGVCSAGTCVSCTGGHTGDQCEIAPGLTVSGCPDPAHCGVFMGTTSTCDGISAYQLSDGDAVLYRNSGSWYIGPSSALADCGTADAFLRSGSAGEPQGPSHPSYAGWSGLDCYDAETCRRRCKREPAVCVPGSLKHERLAYRPPCGEGRSASSRLRDLFNIRRGRPRQLPNALHGR